jgi:1-acyl-sn-glycerol-3-phosphate acyltransferase
MGMSVRVTGTPPRRPFCLVANHLSYVDALLVSVCVDAVLVSRADVRHWPILGHLAWMAGTLFIDRSLSRDVIRVNELIMEAIKRGDGVVFFPEGTSTRGVDVGKFRSPLLAFPVEREMSVHYATITYRTHAPDPPASQSVCWWGDMTFVDHVYGLLTLRGFEACIHFGETPVRDANRKNLARRLRSAVASHFVPVSQSTES